jgi:hypothetical protein
MATVKPDPSNGSILLGEVGDRDAQGTLEGIVPRSSRPGRYGCEITAWLREQGFSDIAKGTVYTLLIRVEQRGLPPRVLEDMELPRRTARTAKQLHEGESNHVRCR